MFFSHACQATPLPQVAAGKHSVCKQIRGLCQQSISLQTFERPVLLNLHPDHTDRIKEQTAPGKPRTQTVTTGLL